MTRYFGYLAFIVIFFFNIPNYCIMRIFNFHILLFYRQLIYQFRISYVTK